MGFGGGGGVGRSACKPIATVATPILFSNTTRTRFFARILRSACTPPMKRGSQPGSYAYDRALRTKGQRHIAPHGQQS